MKLIVFAAAWYFVGMLCFYHLADWSIPSWTNGYYFWDKSKDVLFAAVIAYEIPRSKFNIIFYFCTIRLIWEVIAITINSNINNSLVIDFLFLIFLAVWGLQLIREWLRLN